MLIKEGRSYQIIQEWRDNETAGGELWEGWRGAASSAAGRAAREIDGGCVGPTSNVKQEHDLRVWVHTAASISGFREEARQQDSPQEIAAPRVVLAATEQIRAAATLAPNGENPLAGGRAACHEQNTILATVIDLHSCYRFST